MKYLLDTGIWLWSVSAVDRLNQKAKAFIQEGEDELYFSAVSTWEISIKAATGKLRLPEPPVDYVPSRLSSQRIQNLSITSVHALGVYSLPRHHDDPFDRMLIAQARAEKMTILTADRAFRSYDVPVFWCGR
ncbi:MAG TPA: type II toxin-antitoxin system VapC family toxin [Candidatus Acidoferrales bacterium]